LFQTNAIALSDGIGKKLNFEEQNDICLLSKKVFQMVMNRKR
jgi:hypothetical protein